MTIPVYQSCSNPISGETFRTLYADTDAFIMEWTVQPKGYVAFEHIHLHQDEIFHIKKGEIKVWMNGREQIAGAGESITVPKGVAHIAHNNKEETLECVVMYQPGLDYKIFMQCFCGLVNDGFIDERGGIDIQRMGYFLVKMKAKCMTRPTTIPAPLFVIALWLFYIRGAISGWKKLYERYTGE